MKKIICAVRFDDICPTMNWVQFNKAIALMDQYGIKPLLGIIPDNKDPEQFCGPANEDFWDEIKKLQERGYEVALHGCFHVYDNRKNGMVNPWSGGNTEFSGHTYENQYKKIRHGKEILESHGIYTDIFFAPSHSYDKTTLRALNDIGFKYISDGKSRRPYIQYGIKCIPCRFFGTPKVRGNGIHISVCHLSKWDKYPDNYKKLKYFCDKYQHYIIPFSSLKKLEEGNFVVEKIYEKIYILFIDIVRRKIASISFFSLIYRKFFTNGDDK